MSEQQLLPEPAPLAEGAITPVVGDYVRFNTPARQDLNGNSPMILKAIDEATGLATLTRQTVELHPEIPIYVHNLIKVDAPYDATAQLPEEPEVPVEPEPEPPQP